MGPVTGGSLCLQALNDCLGHGTGTARVLPGDQVLILDDMGFKGLLGDAVVRPELAQFVLQAERDGFGALRRLLLRPGEPGDVLRPLTRASPVLSETFSRPAGPWQTAETTRSDSANAAVSLPRSSPVKSYMTPCPPVK